MRSEIVLASLHTKNRFELCHQVFQIVRKLHKPGNRVQDTATDALHRLAYAERQQGGAPSAKPLAEAVDGGNVAVIFPAESPESQWELIVRSA